MTEQQRREAIARAHAKHRQESEERPVELKRCTKCGQYKPVGMFYKQKSYATSFPYETVYRPMSACMRCTRRSQNRSRRLRRASQ